KIRNSPVPVIVLLNKIDVVKERVGLEQAAKWKEAFPKAEIIPVSALKGRNLEVVLEKILALLPTHPAYFDKEELTDKPERFFVAEIIREKILTNYEQEIPYSCEVLVEDFNESEKLVRIRANIYVMRESQKGIILGHQGRAIKKVGTEARLDIEKFLQKKVFLELFVKVDKDWRDSERELKRFGYI
ncbi:MAG TPA: GTPase Era, partial [Bacteroidia bacterium]|nr:GTPase Era [Bacteroidia bacterium]